MRKLLGDWYAAGTSSKLFWRAKTLNESHQSLENSDPEAHLRRRGDPTIVLASRTTHLDVLAPGMLSMSQEGNSKLVIPEMVIWRAIMFNIHIQDNRCKHNYLSNR